MLQVMPGFQQPVQLDKKLKFYGGNHHTKKDFNQFVQDYDSPFEGNY